MSSSARSYVRPNGNLTRDSPILPRFSTTRLLFVCSVLLVLILTNPANGMQEFFPRSWWRHSSSVYAKSKSSQNTSWLFGSLRRVESVTNYGIMALETSNRGKTITVSALFRSVVICQHDSFRSEISAACCNAIGTWMQMTWNGTNATHSFLYI